MPSRTRIRPSPRTACNDCRNVTCSARCAKAGGKRFHA